MDAVPPSVLSEDAERRSTGTTPAQPPGQRSARPICRLSWPAPSRSSPARWRSSSSSWAACV